MNKPSRPERTPTLWAGGRKVAGSNPVAPTKGGAHSHSADIVIFDALNCPVLHTGETAVLPVEGVYGIIEVKSPLSKADTHLVSELRHAERPADGPPDSAAAETGFDFAKGHDGEVEVQEVVSFGNENGRPARLVSIFHPAGDDLTIARATKSRVSVFGIDFAFEGGSGFANPFSWAA